MESAPPPPITSASLKARPEWQVQFPGSWFAWEEVADEGQGHGFDGLDPSALVRAYCHVDATWPEVLGWYRAHLSSLGWDGAPTRESWWTWLHAEHPRERLQLLDRSTLPPAWTAFVFPSPEPRPFLYEVIFTARSDGSPMALDA